MTRVAVLSILADSVLGLQHATHPLRVGIDGRSAAGKTTFADELAVQLAARGRSCVRASIDDFHPPGYKHRAALGDFTPETYAYEGYDLEAFRRLLLEPLGPGGSRRCKTRLWDAFHDRPFAEEWLTLSDDAILIVDGAYLLLPELRECFELTIWLDIDEDTMLTRAQNRDIAWIGSVERVRERYQKYWIPRHRFYEETTRPQDATDIAIDNRDFASPRIVRNGLA